MKKTVTKIKEHFGSTKICDAAYDVEYWRSLTTEQKFDGAWEMIKDYYTSKGREDELRFRRDIRTVGSFKGRVRNNRRLRSNGVRRDPCNKGS